VSFHDVDDVAGSGVGVQSDGGTVASVFVDYGSGRSFGAVRLNPATGERDRTFDADGRRRFRAEHGDGWPYAVAIQPIGNSFRIVLGGYRYGATERYRWLMAGLTPDGQLDRTFGRNGFVRTATDELCGRAGTAYITQIVPLADGRLVVGGSACAWAAGAHRAQDSPALARYLPDGRLDRSFSEDGVVYALPKGRDDTPGGIPLTGVAVTPDGSVKWSAYVRFLAGPDELAKMVVGGVLPDGTFDPAFGRDGNFEISVGPAADAAFGIALDADGRLLMTGRAEKSQLEIDAWLVLLRLTTQPSNASSIARDR
jgi:uncharacterized delta-60 repeat protein